MQENTLLEKVFSALKSISLKLLMEMTKNSRNYDTHLLLKHLLLNKNIEIFTNFTLEHLNSTTRIETRATGKLFFKKLKNTFFDNTLLSNFHFMFD